MPLSALPARSGQGSARHRRLSLRDEVGDYAVQAHKVDACEARYSPAFDVLALSDGDRRARTLQISPGRGMYSQLAATKFPCETQERWLSLNFWWSLRTAA